MDHFGALHGQEESHRCYVCRSHQEPPLSFSQVKTYWTSVTSYVLLQYDNARPHIARSTVATIQDLLIVFPILPIHQTSPSVIFTSFGPLKMTRGVERGSKSSKSDEEYTNGYVQHQKTFLARGIHVLPKR